MYSSQFHNSSMVWTTPPDWMVADWHLAVEEILAPWVKLHHDQIQASHCVLSEEQVAWGRLTIAGVSCRDLLLPQWSEADVKMLLQEMLMVVKYLHDCDLYHGAICLEAIVLRESDSAPVLVGAVGDVQEAVQALAEDRDLEAANLAALQRKDLQDLAIVMLQLLRGSASSVSPRIPHGLEPELSQVLRSMIQPHRKASIHRLVRRLGSPQDWREMALPWLWLMFGLVAMFAVWRMLQLLQPQLSQIQLFQPQGLRSPNTSQTLPITQVKPATSPEQTSEVIGVEGFQSKLDKALGSDRDRLKDLNLSEVARSGMGSYYRRDYERWLTQLSPFGMGEPVVGTLTDAQFFWMFPSLRGKALDPRILGQLWYGMAHDQIEGIAQRQFLAVAGEHGGLQDKVKLAPGQGKVYQIKLAAKQGLELKLSVSQGDARLTVVNGELFLLKYSSERSFSVPALSSGKTYQIIVTPNHEAGAEVELELSKT